MTAPPRRGPLLVVISGPSGVGKTSVCAELARRPGFERVVTVTTRSPRGGERDGTDYHFTSRERFLADRDAGRFLEWAEVHGNLYATPAAAARQVLDGGRHALLNIDVQGAASIRASGFPALLVFLIPPSFTVLAQRLRGRGTDPADEIAHRIRGAAAELARQDEFDLKVLSDEIVATADRIEAALAAPAPDRPRC
ncbi:MAG: guanylate kinase [Planctomycetaceae bacterium]